MRYWYCSAGVCRFVPRSRKPCVLVFSRLEISILTYHMISLEEDRVGDYGEKVLWGTPAGYALKALLAAWTGMK